MRHDYVRDPAAITRLSFAAIAAACDFTRLPPGLAPIAARLVHACGMPEIVDDLAWRGSVAEAGHVALAAGAPILTDGAMTAEGITRARLPAGNAVLCPLRDESVPARARDLGTTRSAAALDLWLPHLEGAVVAIGNAPTALFRLLEMLAEGAPRPAALFAFPVGFIGAAESKEALIASDLDVAFLTLRGRRGGSALAAAAVNALARAEP